MLASMFTGRECEFELTPALRLDLFQHGFSTDVVLKKLSSACRHDTVRIGCHQVSDFIEHGSSERCCFDGQASPVFVRQSQATTVELLFENALRFDKSVNDGLLVALYPAGEYPYDAVESLDVVHG
jgi:hypothetical protein